MVKRVVLDAFKPRTYQMPIFKALEEEEYKYAILVMPRGSGKDLFCWNYTIRAAFKRVGIYYYLWPKFVQAKRNLWDNLTSDGKPYLDFIPPDLVAGKNSQEMKITLINGSIIQFLGTDNPKKYNALRGSNPFGIVCSEYAWHLPEAFDVISGRLAMNNGWAIFNSTPFGKNHFWKLYNKVKDSPNWFVYHLTLDDTQHMTQEMLDYDRERGKSEEWIQQEYYCSWDKGVEGSYYARYLPKIDAENRICVLPVQTEYKVHTAWDLGMDDYTSIIFFQVIGNNIHIIDTYQNSGEGFEHYVEILDKKRYLYGKHIAPFDIKVRELGTGMSRLEKMRTLGVNFTIAPSPREVSFMDGIERVRSTLNRIWIDQEKGKPLIEALENYRKKWDEMMQIHLDGPVRDRHTHIADALRYMCISLKKLQTGLTPEDIERNYREALSSQHGPSAHPPLHHQPRHPLYDR